jgi:sugar-specific transcriptional regulator TrmB
MGAWFIMRELVRKGVIENEHAHQHCYVPVKRVRTLIQRLNGTSLENLSKECSDLREYKTFLTDNWQQYMLTPRMSDPANPELVDPANP